MVIPTDLQTRVVYHYTSAAGLIGILDRHRDGDPLLRLTGMLLSRNLVVRRASNHPEE